MSIGSEPSIGESVNVTCESSSNTFPPDHDLVINYIWIVDDIINPSGSRFKYSSTRSVLTIAHVLRTDHNTLIECRSKENVTGAILSNKSNTVELKVLREYQSVPILHILSMTNVS